MYLHQKKDSSSKPRKPGARAARFLIIALLAAAPSAVGVTVPKEGIEATDRGTGRRPNGFVTPELRVEPTLDLFRPGSADLTVSSRLGGFFTEHGEAWEVRWDVRSDRPHLLQGSGVPLLPGAGNELRFADLGLERAAGIELGVADVEQLLRRKLRQWEGLLGISESDLVLDLERSVGYGPEKHFWSVEFQQTHHGVPVEARVFFRVNHGNIVQFGTNRVADIDIDPNPRWSRERALITLRRRVGLKPDLVEWSDRGTLKILPTRKTAEGPAERYLGASGGGYGHRLVWEMAYFDPGAQRSYRALVDARSGRLLEHLDLIRYANISAEVYLDDHTLPKASMPVPHGIVTLFSNGAGPFFPRTDADGNYDFVPGEDTASFHFTGDFVRIEDTCGGIGMVNDTTGNMDFGGSPGTNCSTPLGVDGGAGNTDAARTTYYQTTKLNRTAAQYLPTVGLINTTTLLANTNLNETCNAFWNGQSINFFKEGDGCSNTGELAHVIHHEYGHAIDDATGSTTIERGTGEALADTFAVLETRDPCIGNNFRPGVPCHNCRDSCTGVRDLEAFSVGGISTVARPDTVEADDGLNCDRFICPFSSNFVPYRGPMGYEGHCESVIAGAANWDLTKQMIAAWGPDEGWERTEELWYGSLFPAQSAYRVAQGGLCNPGALVDGCAADNWYTVFLAVDDTDGNLANGTPNGCRIFNAFLNHGIACGDPVPCSGGCDPAPFPDAGPDQAICLGESATVGTPALPGHTYSWSPGGGTTAQITVMPDATTTYTVTATTDCGSFQDEVRVIVDDGSGDGLEEDFEGELAWTTTGLWHRVSESDCASPGFSSPVSAMYYGQDDTCDYKTPGANFGELISPPVFNLGPDSTLSFDFFREVEAGSEGYDVITVSVAEAGTGAWQVLWSRDSSDPSTAAWDNSGNISLADFFGMPIQVRFRFDTVDSSFNGFTGFLVDNVVVTASGACDLPPRVLIGSPEDGAIIDNGQSVELTGSALDEDGNLTAGLIWSSTLDGELGSGGAVTTSLSLGSHEISASVADSAGSVGSASVAVEVVDATPVVSVSSPADGSSFGSGEAVSFAGTASDFEDGDLTAALVWTSDLDGVIGSGGGFVADALSAGDHVIAAEATDSAGNVGGQPVAITIEALVDLPPEVAITAPADGTVAAQGASVAFAASAVDPEDGDLAASLVWTSSLDGEFGAGANPSTTALSLGIHTISASVVDSAGQEGSASLEIVVTPTGAPPVEVVLISRATEDGYVRESSEDSETGGFANSSGNGSRPIRVGDASGDRQYRSVLSFDTSGLPDGALLYRARLRLRRGGLVGTDPFTTLGACRIDVATGGFGGAALTTSDFAAPATAAGVAELSAPAADLDWSEADLDALGLTAVATDALTQLRLAFEVDDDDNGAYDYMGFLSGENADAGSRPQLVVTYVEVP